MDTSIQPNLAKIFDQLSTPVAVVSPDRSIRWGNAAFERFCQTAGNPIGLPAEEVIDPIIERSIGELLTTGLSGNRSILQVFKLGNRIRAWPLRLDDAQDWSVVLEFMYGIPVESSMGEASDFAQVFEALPGGPFRTDFSRDETKFSKQLVRHLGYDEAVVERLGSGSRFWESIIHPEDWGRLVTRYLSVETDDRNLTDARVRDANGKYRNCRIHAFVLARTPDGHQLDVVGYLLDVTDDHHRLAGDWQRLKLLERLVAASDDGVIITNTDGDIIAASPQARELLGLDESTLQDAKIDDFLVLNDSRQETIPSAVAWATSVGAGSIRNATLRTPSGDRPVLVEAEYQQDEGALTGVQFMLRTTERDLALLRRVDHGERLRSLGQLASGIAHDFNHALGVITAASSSVAREIHDARRAGGRLDSRQLDRMDALLESMARSAEMSTQLTKRLLQFGGHPGDKDSAAVPVDLAESLKAVASLLGQIPLRPLDVRIDMELLAPVMFWSAGDLEAVFFNLGINAANAHANRLSISAEEYLVAGASESDRSNGPMLEPGRYVKVVVSDNGEGMPGELLDRIFDPYFTTSQSGSGLGLSIAYRTIEEAGGSVTVQSELGIGSRFEVYLRAAVGSPVP